MKEESIKWPDCVGVSTAAVRLIAGKKKDYRPSFRDQNQKLCGHTL
jgi:hypothetical protein